MRKPAARSSRPEQVVIPAPGASNGKVAKLDAQISELEQMLKEGRLSPAIAGAALEQARAERSALVAASSRTAELARGKVSRMFPKAAQTLRDQVDTLREALSDPEIVQRARPIVSPALRQQDCRCARIGRETSRG